jgi:AraC-like DNA-binding protein
MLDVIHQHYNQRLTLAGLARILRRQSAYLGRLFHDEIGITVHEYITRARMVFGAVQILAGVKIEAVSLDLGYRSKKNFYRQFKRHFGRTPEVYRHDHDEATARAPLPAPRTTRGLTISGPVGSTLSDGCTKDRRAVIASYGGIKMARALAGSCIAMLVTDECGHCIGATKRAVALTGYSIEELRAMPSHVLFPGEPARNETHRVQVLYPASTARPANTVLQTKSAGRIYIHLASIEILSGRTPPLRARAFSEGTRSA